MKCPKCVNYWFYLAIENQTPIQCFSDIPCLQCSELKRAKSEFQSIDNIQEEYLCEFVQK